MRTAWYSLVWSSSYESAERYPDHSCQLCPAQSADEILVYGWNSGLDADRIWMAARWRPWTFRVGEVLMLQRFRLPGNAGLFVVSGHVDRLTLRIAEVPALPVDGRLTALAPEVNAEGATVQGCFGSRAGPAALCFNHCPTASPASISAWVATVSVWPSTAIERAA